MIYSHGSRHGITPTIVSHQRGGDKFDPHFDLENGEICLKFLWDYNDDNVTVDGNSLASAVDGSCLCVLCLSV